MSQPGPRGRSPFFRVKEFRPLGQRRNFSKFPGGDDIALIRRLRIVDGIPYSYIMNYLPVAVAERISKEDLNSKTMVENFRETAGFSCSGSSPGHQSPDSGQRDRRPAFHRDRLAGDVRGDLRPESRRHTLGVFPHLPQGRPLQIHGGVDLPGVAFFAGPKEIPPRARRIPIESADLQRPAGHNSLRLIGPNIEFAEFIRHSCGKESNGTRT